MFSSDSMGFAPFGFTASSAELAPVVSIGGQIDSGLTLAGDLDVEGNNMVSVDIPENINLKWGATHELAVTTSGGTGTLDGVLLNAPTGWEYVTYDGSTLDPATTESFQEYTPADLGITLAAGDLIAIQSNAAITELRTDGTFLVSPAQDIAANPYKIWDDSISTWSALSTFSITDLGDFVGPANLSNPQSGNIARVVTDQSVGIMYCLASTNPTESETTVINTGTPVVVNSAGTVSVVPSGRVDGQTYYNHFVQVTSGQNSNLVSSGSYLYEVGEIPQEYRYSVGKVGKYLIDNLLVTRPTIVDVVAGTDSVVAGGDNVIINSENGEAVGNVNEAVKQWLTELGVPSGNINDMMYAYLEGLGYTGTMNTKYYKWRQDP